MKYVIEASPSHRGYLTFYVNSIIALILDVVILMLFYEYGLWIYILVISVALYIVIRVVYKTLYTELFRIRIDHNALEFRKGVFNKVVESIELHRIKDFTKKSTFLDQLLGLSTIVIFSTDHSTPIIKFTGLLNKDAKRIINYLQENASDSIVKHYTRNPNGIIGNPILDERLAAKHDKKKDEEELKLKAQKKKIYEP